MAGKEVCKIHQAASSKEEKGSTQSGSSSKGHRATTSCLWHNEVGRGRECKEHVGREESRS